MPDTLRVQPHRVQREFLESAARVRCFIGGIGSGKTFAGSVALLQQPPETVCMVVAPTWRVLKDATIPSFLAVAQDFIKDHRKSDLVTTLRNNTKILFRTGAKETVGRLRGSNLGFCWIDEAALLRDAEVYEVLVGRLRLNPGRIIITSTPKGHNWLYDLSRRADVEVFHAATTENTALPESFYGFVREQYTSELARQELNGEFVDLSGDHMFDRQWFKVRRAAPAGLKWYRFWDLAISTKTHADYTATARVAVDGRGMVWIGGLWQAKAPWPRVKRMILEMAVREEDTVAIGLETVAGFEIAYSELMTERDLAHIAVRSIKPTRDKTARAAPLATRAEGGKVTIVKDRWTDTLIGQAALFPGDTKHDDLLDAVAGALAMTAGSGNTMVIDKTPRLREVKW